MFKERHFFLLNTKVGGPNNQKNPLPALLGFCKPTFFMTSKLSVWKRLFELFLLKFIVRVWRRANLWRGEPTGRCVREWKTPAQRHSSENSGAGPAGDQTLRYKPAAARLARLREQDPGAVQRNGLHFTGRNRRQQTSSHDAQRGEKHQGIQTERPRDLCMGDPRQTFSGRRLR